MTVEEMEAMAAENGLAFLLDHLGLDGLGNEIVALRAERDAAVKALEQIAVWVRDGLDDDPDGVQLARAVFEAATAALASLSAADTEPGGEG